MSGATRTGESRSEESAEVITISPPPEDGPETQRLPKLDSDAPKEGTEVTERRACSPKAVAYDRIGLTMVAGPTPGRVLTLTSSETVLGRGQSADVQIEERGVSRRHACIRRLSETVCTLEDLGSSNGTFVNGERAHRAILQSGDRVQLGSTVVLRVWLTDESDAELHRRLYEGATLDPLTGVYNRAYVLTQLHQELAFARRHGTDLAVLLIDVDHFKEVNDSLGHLAGDAVLAGLVARIVQSCRVEDVVARWGGEEFLVLLRATSRDQAAVLAERVRAVVGDGPIAIDETSVQVSVTVSIGAAALSELTTTTAESTQLIALADARLYRAKAAGRNRVAARL
jgi:diguanylate cyclase (GGDEF)-like protein